MKKNYINKKIALSLVFIILFQVSFPAISFALTSGPSQPEVQSFEPVGTSEMVDLFSGDFNYNIPLLEIGGYPINIAYHAGVGMEQEASWVGLGWNLNPGAINRNMRGIPDDFSGEVIHKEVQRKPNTTISAVISPDTELLGFELGEKIKLKTDLNIGVGLSHNSYKGLSLVGSANFGAKVSKMNSFGLNSNLGVDLENGFSASLNASLHIKNKKGKLGTLNVGSQYNSRAGLGELSFNGAFQKSFYKISSNGSMVNFNTPSYITSSDFNSTAFAFSMDVAIGGEIPFTNIAGSIRGSFSRSTIDGNRSLPSYGYMYHHKANPKVDLLDFNRAFDGPYFDGTDVLPLTNLTNDVYSITGQGMGGAFRSFKNQVNYVTDPFTYTSSSSGSGGIETGVPSSPVSFKAGGNGSVHFIESRAGLWSNNNGAILDYNAQKVPMGEEDKALFENTYIKQIGELSSDQGRFVGLGGNEPLAFELNKHELDNNLIGQLNAVNEKRVFRNQLTIPKTFRDKKVEYQDGKKHFGSYLPGLTDGKLVTDNSKNFNSYFQDLKIFDSQICEYEVLRADGMRYIYGRPAFNISQEETIFNTEKTVPQQNGIVTYNPNELTPEVSKGIDDFVSRELMPAYAYSHLITEVLSPDYSDLTGDGPSDDDYGNWVKFNYTAHAGPMSPSKENYNWRFPYDENIGSAGVAQFNEGLKSNNSDNKASYTYGEKELWFLNSIESKTHIAVFHTKDRNDAVGVNNILGNTSNISNSTVKNQQLDKIEYYMKNDLLAKGNEAKPIKSVHFIYKDILCLGVPNNPVNSVENGKHTLTELYFTYGNSKKGEFSKYKFEYAENPSYNKKSQDRWGNFKPEPSNVSSNPTMIDNSDPLSNSDWPYSEQDDVLADTYAAAWNLSTIHLPTGGEINVEYESDDYAFIQDKRAGQMFKLKGFAPNEPSDLSTVSNALFDAGNVVTAPEFNNYLVVELEENEILSKSDFKNKYLEDIDLLYFRALVEIADNKHEFVPGYSVYEDYGVFESGNNIYAWIKLKGVGFDDKEGRGEANPIAKASWQFARLQMPEVVWPGSAFDLDVVTRAIKQVGTLITKEVPRMLKGFNKSLAKEGFAQNCIPEKSWVRLNNPTYAKKGGGCRVKKLSMKDNWSQMNGSGNDAEDSVYGQHYFYKDKVTLKDGTEKVISSGVASYEPILGNDENPFKEPIYTNEARLLAPDNEHYIEGPLGEAFYPSASVGYSKVMVVDIRPSNLSKRTATGYSLNEFYTAKDYPFEIKINKGDTFKEQPKPLLQLLSFRTRDNVTASKGYSIILNDMHGKPKSQGMYGGVVELNNEELDLETLDNNNYISGQEFIYKTSNNGSLENIVNVINNDGSIESQTIGVESEIALDFREHLTNSFNAGVDVNVDTYVIPFLVPVPLVIPTVWPSFEEQETRFRSAVTTKVINQHGLIDKVRIVSQGAIVETQNMLYDAQTGDVLLTSVNNEFRNVGDEISPTISEDNLIYNMSYPAHWAYEGMQQASQNIGLETDITLNILGVDQMADRMDLYFPGDEVLAWGNIIKEGEIVNASTKLWVLEVEEEDGPIEHHTIIKLVDRYGDLFKVGYNLNGYLVEDTWRIKTIRSGHRNQQSFAVGNLMSLKNPAETILSGNSADAEDIQVLDFTAQEFADNWNTYCGNGEQQIIDVETEVEYCTECADIIFVLDVSGSVQPWEFESMKDDVEQTIQGLENLEENNFRYSIIYFDTNAEIIIPFTEDGVEASGFVDPGTNAGTDLDASLGDIATFIDNTELDLRSNCGLNVLVFTDAGESEMDGDDDMNDNDFTESINLKENYSGVIGVVRYDTPSLNDPADAEGASVASPGPWNYFGPVDDNGYDSDLTPRRFIPTQFSSVIPNIHAALNCQIDTITEQVILPAICGASDGDIINPFIHGIRGNWRVQSEYVHENVNRVQDEVDATTGIHLNTKGYYEDFNQFWHKPSIEGELWESDKEYYTKVTETTLYDPYGEALEQKDALDIYSSILLGYDKKLPLAVTVNSKYKEMAFIGFEEYGHALNEENCHPSHHLNIDVNNKLNEEESHTGYYSYEINANQTDDLFFDVQCEGNGMSYTNSPHELNYCEECIPTFSPNFKVEPGAENRFVIDMWIKDENNQASIDVDNIHFDGSISSKNFIPSGPKIEGWHRIYGFFELEPNTDKVKLSFNNPSSNSIYMDDIRMYPYDASMKSFVYHPASLKLIAELDENNHATFYEYDEAWNLIRTKKETERGIATIQETVTNVKIER